MLKIIFFIIFSFPAFSSFVPSEVLVKFKNKKRAILQAEHYDYLFDNIYRIKLKPDIDIFDVINKLKKDEDIIYIEPNYIRRICIRPNDPDYNKQWGLHKINAEDAWKIEKGKESVVIAILDTGIDYNHPDLSGKIIGSMSFVSSEPDPMDYNGHGTHVSGIAAASTNNNIGIASLAWNCKILAIKCLNKKGYGNDFDIASATIYAANNGAKVINMSFGDDEFSNTLKIACDYAYGTRGCILVGAAGNSGRPEIMYPAGYPNVIAVAALNENDNKASFSNFGDWVDVGAPGVNIISTSLTNTYKYLGGTSMAAPFVSALAALLFSKDQILTNACVFDIIVSTQDNIGRTDFGRINAYMALKGENRPPSTFTLTQPENLGFTSSPYPTFRWEASRDPDFCDEVTYSIFLAEVGETLTKVRETENTFFTLNFPLSLNKIYNWQVKAMDKKGSITSSGISTFTTTSLIVYPNPSKFGQTIRFRGIPLTYKEANISIYTIAGELVDKIPVGKGGEVPWEVKNIASGVYIYIISNPDRIFASGKIGIIK